MDRATPTGLREQYVDVDIVEGKKVRDLWTIGAWTGADSKMWQVTIAIAPAVVNYGYTPTDTGSSMRVYVWQGKEPESDDKSSRGWPISYGELAGRYGFVLNQEGKYTFEVDSVGAKWWLRIGVG